MRNKLYILLFGILSMTFTGCIENEDPLWAGSQVEFDAAIYNAPALSKTFPILTRVPAYGRAINATATNAGVPDPLINRTAGSAILYVNLIGKHLSADQMLSLSVVAEETTAVSGVHYTIPSEVTIPANSSVAEVPVTILNPGPSATPVVLVLQLDGNGTISPSENYKRVGLSIAQN
jgi:hypothetical protein